MENQMKIAIFDLDGTIADTIADLGDAVNYGLRNLNHKEHTYEQYKKMVGNGAQVLCQRSLPVDFKHEADMLLTLFSEYYANHYLDKTKLYDGIKHTIQVLSDNKVKLAIATNKPQTFARPIIQFLLPDIHFESVLGGCSERPKKPDRAIIDEILSSFHGKNDIYMIGDSNVDIQTAKNANIHSIGCEWGFRDKEELISEGAEFIAKCPEDIIHIILG